MKLPPFLLDQWLERHTTTDSPIRHDLASSFGPGWTLGELVDLAGGGALDALLTTPLRYQPAAGSVALREAIAELEGISPEAVVVTTGAAEGLLIQWILAAEPGANVVVPFPGFPPFIALPEMLNVEVRRYHLRPENAFRLDVEDIKELVDTRTSLVLVNTPHNPTGAVVEPETLRVVHDLCASRGVTFVVDQVSPDLLRRRTTERDQPAARDRRRRFLEGALPSRPPSRLDRRARRCASGVL